MTPKPIVLIGPMAAGKSAIGHQLAALLSARFYDTDRMITDEHGPIPQIFARQGERFFRAREAAAVASLLQSEDRTATVIAVGGGAVLDAGTAQLLESNAVVVYLSTDLATVLPRISGSKSRPLLAGGPAQAWEQLFENRRPVYERLADLTLDTRHGSIRETADRLVRRLHEGEYLQ